MVGLASVQGQYMEDVDGHLLPVGNVFGWSVEEDKIEERATRFF